MSWFNLLKADNVIIDADDESLGWYDPATDETTINLAQSLGIQEIVITDAHEELHKQTVAEIHDEMFEYVSSALHKVLRKEHFRARGDKVMFKNMPLVIDTISVKVANSIAFNEILTHVMTFSPTNDATQDDYAARFDTETEYVWDNIVFPIIEAYAKRATGFANAKVMNHGLGQEFRRVVRNKANEAFKKHTNKDTDWMKSLGR